jgi:hypothetical protein
MEKPVQGIAIGTIITVLGAAGGVGVWYDGIKDQQHAEIDLRIQQTSEHAASETYRKSIELELRAINIELKLLRTIEEDRPLSSDEEDRRDYLESLRDILLEAQREEVES